jgi:hypothetical protein
MSVTSGQGALFELPPRPKRKNPLDDIVPLYAPGEPRPWDVIDAADEHLGWEYRYVDHRRATDIRLDLQAGVSNG